jgi:hypothetical protein
MVDGKESTLKTIAASETLERLIDQGPRSADVVANRDSVPLKISGSGVRAGSAKLPFCCPTLAGAQPDGGGTGKVADQPGYEDSVRFIRATTG